LDYVKYEARLNGDTAVLVALLSNGIPVIVRQWPERPHDGVLVGHYRVVRSYDQENEFELAAQYNPNYAVAIQALAGLEE
jgi:hypothetical protein